ncbi:protein ECT2-like [Amphiura filiformis]|uniref:protein ECT2-like n=1 Tax=Amphiura filiformis TaxID=82378 RepID=UPI003B21E031
MTDLTSEMSCTSYSATMTTQEENLETTVTPECRICLVGQEAAQNQQLIEAMQTLNMSFVESETGIEYISAQDDDQQETVFVMQEFDGPVYSKLQRSGCRLLGPTVFCKAAANLQPLPFSNRPLYCSHMADLIICFTGFTTNQKDDLKRLADIVHHMGGSIRKDFSSRVTHLVANATAGNKYRTAVSLGTPIMTQEWIHKTWERRHDMEASAIAEDMLLYKMSPFFKCVLSFVGFSDEEQKHMEESTVMQGGAFAAAGEESCTHLVIDENVVTNMFDFPTNGTLKVVKQEWFWASIQISACADESLYAYATIPTTPATPGSASKVHTPTGSALMKSSRKRRRLRESIAALSQETTLSDSPVMPRKRRSSVQDPNVTTVSVSSILDATSTPETVAASYNADCTPMQVDKTPVSSTPAKPLSKRQMVAMELLQTETNYVSILHTIISVFKEPMEQEQQTGGPILDQEEIKTIFGKLPDIYDVHRKLKEDIETLLSEFTEDKCIGQIVLKHASDMMKAYPPFVNFFEFSKQTVEKCEKQKPRFHAFLKICHSKPECSRQTLTELLIRPVQRLPSMILLLTDLAKRTESDHPDKTHLEKALESLKKVTEHINEDKRKTDGHTQMFDIVNDIEGVPPHLLSAHRSFIMRADTIEIGDSESKKGDNFSVKGGNVTMFLFSDTLEICKRRGKLGASYKSPHITKTPVKCFKHIELLPLSHIRRILDVNDTQDCQDTFCLLCKPHMDTMQRADRVYMFKMVGDEMAKTDWLKTLCQHMANTTCKADAENFLIKIDPEELEITKSDFESSKLERAKRVARRATRKVGRTFSFNKTPRNTLSRAVSSLSTNSMGSPMEMSTGDTPQHHSVPQSEEQRMTAARLASTTSLRTLSPIANKPPMTPKRLKSRTIGPSGASWM